MKILSLFDGISCARVALEKAGIPVEVYYASEIDKYAIQISQKNWQDIKQIGSVVGMHCQGLNNIDLLIGGSPCQDLSIAKKNRKGLDGERSGLFWEYVRILNEVKPKYFILENVNSMPREAKELITKTLGVEPIMINASLVSAQNRKRLFWTNIPNVTLPEDKGLFLKDILEENVDDKYNLSEKILFTFSHPSGKNASFLPMKPRKENDKAVTLTARYYKMGRSDNYIKKVGQIGRGGQGDRIYSPIRKLTPIECERLQGLPDNYTAGVSNTQRYKACGNAFNVDVVAHILSFIKSNEPPTSQ